ncbi:hypothetical protein [Haloarcula sp. CGMCC 1.6347]|uniref:hypothetical protein n=1 Tax=Haloarcula sp. CGMCC 1.6347 TaxID=3111455 RepID=UPI00300F560C
MPPSKDSGSANVGGVIPVSWKTAMDDKRRSEWANSDRDDPRSRSAMIHDAVELWLSVQKAQGNLPQEAADDVSGLDADEVLSRHGLATVTPKDQELEAEA